VTELRYSKSQYNLAKYRYTDEKGKIVDEQTHFDTGYTGGITLMQYTGLKDRNGTEIYEGDIIREKVAKDEYILAEVVYVNGCFMGKEPTHEPEYPIHDFLKGEVIGNIYENSELLQEVEE